jgi:protein-disulfide isomerase
MLAKLYQSRLHQNSMAYNEDVVKLTLPASERDHIQGPNTAPVTLIEYGDYECPCCAQAYLIIKEVQERLGTKLRFVFRNFPFTYARPRAYRVALAAEAAAVQNKFWDMYNYLFRHGQTNTDENLQKSAAGLGLQIDKSDRDFNEQTHKVHLYEDIESGKSSGVKNTPTFFYKWGTSMMEHGIWTVFCPHLTKRVYSVGNLGNGN